MNQASQLIALVFTYQVISFFIEPFFSILSRSNEYEADNFASKQEVKKLNEIVEDNKSTDLTMTPEMRKAQEAYRAEQDEIENIKKRVIWTQQYLIH